MLTRLPAIHNATQAFCEGLRGPIAERPSRADVDYAIIDAEVDEKVSSATTLLPDAITTSQARTYWEWCSGSALFPLITFWNKYMDARRTPTVWQTVFFPQSILDEWRLAAQDAGVKVSTYDLLTSWLHMVSAIYNLT